MQTYADGTDAASRAVERLIFLACSLTLDFASIIEYVEFAAVERERTNVMAALLLGADTRSFEAERDMMG